jgi:hypothetical protein
VVAPGTVETQGQPQGIAPTRNICLFANLTGYYEYIPQTLDSTLH